VKIIGTGVILAYELKWADSGIVSEWVSRV